MPAGTESRLFSTLPKELRCLIWEQTLTPRCISMIVDSFSQASPPSFEDLYIKFLTPPKVPALRICQESRNVALQRGYKLWKMEDTEGAPNMMWNPRIDFIFVSGPCARHLSMNSLILMFPTEAEHISRLALETSVLPKRSPELRRMALRQWVSFVELKELVLVYNGIYERECIQAAKDAFYETKATQCPWSIPRDIEYTLKTLDKSAPVMGEDPVTNKKSPKIRIVDDEAGMLSGESLELNLRCWPCHDVLIRETPIRGLGYAGRN